MGEFVDKRIIAAIISIWPTITACFTVQPKRKNKTKHKEKIIHLFLHIYTDIDTDTEKKMPAVRRAKGTNKKVDEDSALSAVDVQYNPDIIAGLLKDLALGTDKRCDQIRGDTDFLITSMRQAFHLELIKLPSSVKNMSVKRFREEFGCSLDAVTRGTINGPMKTESSTALDRNVARQSIYQTPAHPGKKALLPMQTPSMRAPKEGEMLLSANGSPLGEFSTVVKAPKNTGTIIPPTPGVFVPLKGEIVDIDELDIDTMPQEVKHETLNQMQAMMDNMRMMMEKLQSKI